ncbi:MAG: hypothetical protein Q9166_007995 [cf. Caloplaca sp. 2 TL-2023]
MDFPRNVLTNIHSLHLPYFRWTLHQLDQSVADIHHLETEHGNRDTTRHADGIALALRRNGFLVNSKREFGFWTFDISKSTPESPDTQRVRIANIIGHHGFKSVKSGIFASRQLRPVSRGQPTTAVAPNEQRPNTESSQNPSTFSEVPGTNNDILHTIYRAFISALSSSILYSLVKGGDWLEFGNDSCLRAYTDPSFLVGNSIQGLRGSNNTVEQLCLDVRWSPSGILTVGSRSIRLPGYSQLSDIVANRHSLVRNSLKAGDDVLISPFGTRCGFLGTEKQVFGQVKADRHFKTSSKAWFGSRGLESKPGTEWVSLQLYNRSLSTKNPPDFHDMKQIWWPAHLCFVNHASSYSPVNGVLARISDGTFVDPLEKAEQWFLGREGREEAMEMRRREEEESKRRKSQSDSADHGLVDIGVDDMAQTNQYLSAQEASGIYPTPPDGLASHTQNSMVAQDTPIASTAEALEAQMPGHDSPDMIISGTQFTKDGSHDLFGDMDTEMFDANGLTEADFNFFDEPDEEGNEVELGYSPSDSIDVRADENDDKGKDVHERLAGDVVLDAIQLETAEEPDATEVYADRDILPDNFPSPLHGNEMTLPLPENDRVTQQPRNEAESKSRFGQGDGSQVVDNPKKRSSFDLVTIGGYPQEFHEKYLDNGKYAVRTPEAQNGHRPSHRRKAHDQGIPKIGLLLGSSDDSTDGTEDTEADHEIRSGLTYKGFTELENDAISTTISGLAKVDMGSEGGRWPTRKRKREPSTESNCPATPADSVNATQSINHPSDLYPLTVQECPEYRALRNIRSPLEDALIDMDSIYVGNDQDFIQIAQLVADQKILQNGNRNSPSDTTSFSDDLPSPDRTQSSPNPLQDVLPGILSDVHQCDLKSFSELDLNIATNLSQKTTSLQDDIENRRQAVLQSRSIKAHNEVIFETRMPYLKVQRGKDAIDIASPALYFWEELGLAPSQQKKNVVSLCIYPDSETLRGAASAFLTTLENSYQSCKLGSHQHGCGSGYDQEGLVPVPVTKADSDTVLSSLHEFCEELGTKIPLKEADGTNIVIYMVNASNNEANFPHLCAAFLILFTAYATAAKRSGMTNARDMVLQIIPMSFLANCDSLTIPPPKAYTKLAFEVYSRCSPAPSDDGLMPSPLTSGSVIRLAKSIPKTVNFQLISQPPVALLSSDPCLHMAYSWETEHQWLACAWTDNIGVTCWNATYCLGDPSQDHWAAFAETVKEIFDTTRDMLQPVSLPWRLFIVKDGDLHQQELEVWRLHSSSLSRQQITITVLSVNTDPPLSFHTGEANLNSNIPFPTLNTSPAATTPNDQVLTPDYSSAAVTNTPGRPAQNAPATPSATGFIENDPSARLIDVVSKTWVMISPAPILDPYLSTPCLASVVVSGYLLKCAGADEDDGLIPLGVNIVTTIISKPELGNYQGHVKILREVLEMYSDLATLARLRGLEDWSSGVLPWHVAAARKARRVVERCMRWGEKKKK